MIVEFELDVECLKQLILSNSTSNEIGVLNGDSSLLYYIYTSDSSEISTDDIKNIINKIIEKHYNSYYKSYTFCSGLSGFGYILNKINTKYKLGYENFLNELDIILFQCCLKFLNLNNIDYLHGAMGVGLYFFERKKQLPIIQIVNHICKTSIVSNEGTFWKLKNLVTAKESINLSLSHGIPSILYFLMKSMKFGIKLPVKYNNILYDVSDFIIRNKNAYGTSKFPNNIKEEEHIEYSRLAWCYGDFGVAKSIYEVGEYYSNSDYKKVAESILINLTKRELKNSYVVDPFFCHGSVGLIYIFKKLFKKFNHLEYNQAVHYWQNIYNKQYNNIYKEYLDIYEEHYNKMMYDFDLLNGTLGIKLVLNNKEFQDEIFILDSL